MNEKRLVGKYGLFSTIVVTVIGVGVFSYPSSMAEEVGTDGWIVTIAAGFICMALLFIIYKIVNKNGFISFYDLTINTLGKLFGNVIILLLCFYFIFSISIGMRIFVEVIKMNLLLKTPTEFILLVMIFTGLYIVRTDISVLVKFNEISFIIMFVPMIILLLFSTKNGDITNVLPILQHSPKEYLSALITSTYAFGGFQIAFLILPFMKDVKEIKKTLISSISFITIFYVAVVILCLMFFTKEHTKELIWPTIALVRAIMIPGSFIERWEGIVMALWVFYYYTTFVNVFYFSAELIKKSFKLDEIKLTALILSPIIYLIALYPENIAEINDISNKTTLFFVVLSFIILPFVLLIFKGGRKRGEKSEV